MATACSAGSPNRFPLSDGAATLTSISLPAAARPAAASCPNAGLKHKLRKRMLRAIVQALRVDIIRLLPSWNLAIVRGPDNGPKPKAKQSNARHHPPARLPSLLRRGQAPARVEASGDGRRTGLPARRGRAARPLVAGGRVGLRVEAADDAGVADVDDG